MPSIFDVAIIGAGPAGSATAIALARSGYAVALIDKQIFPREKLCGDFVNPINWPIFRDLGVEERLLAQPHTRVTGFCITSYCGASAAATFSRWTKTDLSVSASDARNWITCCCNGPRKPGSRSERGSESSRFQNIRKNGSWTWAREKAGALKFSSAPLDATPGLPNSSV